MLAASIRIVDPVLRPRNRAARQDGLGQGPPRDGDAMRQEGQDRSGLPEREDPLGALGVTGEDPLAVLRAEDQENVGLIEDPPGELSGAVPAGVGSEALRDPREGVIDSVPDHGHGTR